ncbi:hypothetical protein [Paraburkholderia kururiensis]|uniref:hypothetical protein n=1 Tax=Paraburkholderia kururiensis TaxID=984307 RepID=UPI0034E29EEA
MYITPERCKQVAFADPQYQIQDTLLVLKGNPKKLHSYADVASCKRGPPCVNCFPCSCRALW